MVGQCNGLWLRAACGADAADNVISDECVARDYAAKQAVASRKQPKLSIVLVACMEDLSYLNEVTTASPRRCSPRTCPVHGVTQHAGAGWL